MRWSNIVLCGHVMGISDRRRVARHTRAHDLGDGQTLWRNWSQDGVADEAKTASDRRLQERLCYSPGPATSIAFEFTACCKPAFISRLLRDLHKSFL